MVKFRYLLIWVVIGFFSMAILSFILENYTLKLEAMQIRSYTETAADCALQTGQGIDDFFSEPTQTSLMSEINSDMNRGSNAFNSWYISGNIKGLRIKYDAGNDTYDESDLLNWYVNVSHSSGPVSGTYTSNAAKDRAKAFQYLYNAHYGSETAQEFYAFATSNVCLRSYTQLPYAVSDTSDPENGQIIWVKVPRIALIGTNCLWNDINDFKENMSSTGLSSIYDLTDIGIKRMWKALVSNNYNSTVKGGIFGQYFLTPSKVGISYIPRDLVEKIYQNNLDLLLRARKNGDLQNYSGLVDDTWNYADDKIYNNQASVENFNNIINNGVIAINKNTSTITSIEYKNIDIFNDNNDPLIADIFSGIHKVNNIIYTNYSGIEIASAKLFRERKTANEMKLSGGIWGPVRATNKYEVVAKITFSTDAIVSHKTAVFTNWGTKYDKSSENINDIEIRNGIDTNTVSRNKKYKYTRFYDINA